MILPLNLMWKQVGILYLKIRNRDQVIIKSSSIPWWSWVVVFVIAYIIQIIFIAIWTGADRPKPTIIDNDVKVCESDDVFWMWVGIEIAVAAIFGFILFVISAVLFFWARTMYRQTKVLGVVVLGEVAVAAIVIGVYFGFHDNPTASFSALAFGLFIAGMIYILIWGGFILLNVVQRRYFTKKRASTTTESSIK